MFFRKPERIPDHSGSLKGFRIIGDKTGAVAIKHFRLLECKFAKVFPKSRLHPTLTS
jgi:hypothetical protein